MQKQPLSFFRCERHLLAAGLLLNPDAIRFDLNAGSPQSIDHGLNAASLAAHSCDLIARARQAKRLRRVTRRKARVQDFRGNRRTRQSRTGVRHPNLTRAQGNGLAG